MASSAHATYRDMLNILLPSNFGPNTWSTDSDDQGCTAHRYFGC